MDFPEAYDGFITNQKTTYLWEIPNFCTTCPTATKILNSPIFVHESGLKFQLKMYPQGQREECNEYVSAYLNFLGKETADISYKFAVLNNMDKECHVANGKQKFIRASCWGQPRYVLQKDIMNNRTKFLADNKLKFLCELTVHKIIDGSTSEQNKRPRFDMDVVSNCYNFEQFFASEQFSDITFVATADGKEIRAHKFMLASKSKVFLNMFQNHTQNDPIEIKNIDYQVLMEMFRFIYTNRVNDIAKYARDLLDCAKRFNLNDLKTLCEESLCDSISTSNVLDLIGYAVSHHLTKLRNRVIDYIASNMKEVVNTPGFKSNTMCYPDIFVEILRRCANKT